MRKNIISFLQVFTFNLLGEKKTTPKKTPNPNPKTKRKMAEKKSLSPFRYYSPNDHLCSYTSSATVWFLSSQSFGKKCSWLNKSCVAGLQLHMILELLLLGSSLYLVQDRWIPDRGQRPHAVHESRDWWPGRCDSANRLPSSSCNFMPSRHT